MNIVHKLFFILSVFILLIFFMANISLTILIGTYLLGFFMGFLFLIGEAYEHKRTETKGEDSYKER